MAETKTKPTGTSVMDFLYAVDHPVRRSDGLELNDIFKRVTGWEPRMWGPTMVGYGEYHYEYASGHSGDALATGFSPRKANLVVYVMPGYTNFGPILERLGKWKMGKSCLYINKLADIDTKVLEELIAAGLEDLRSKYPVIGS